MASRLPQFSEDEFGFDRERSGAEKRRKAMRKERRKDGDPIREARRLREETRRRPEVQEYTDDEDFDLDDEDYNDEDYGEADDFVDRLRRESSDYWD